MRRLSPVLAWWPAALAALIALTQSQMGDYVDSDESLTGGNPAPAISSLIDGDFERFSDTVPAMGGVSLVLRAPFAALAGDDPLWRYRLGALACLLVAVLLARWVDARIAANGGSGLRRACIALLIVAGPASLAALDAGHPEEVLGGALCVAACLAALDDRRALAAVLLGLAIGTKQWGVLAAVPVVLILRTDALRVLLGAGGVAALFIVPEVVADPARYVEINRSIGESTRVYAQSLWWPLGADHVRSIDVGGGEAATATTWLLPGWLDRAATSMLTLGIAAGAAVWAWRRRVDPLLLLAALLLLRGALDPLNLEYYAVPGLMALAVWDGLRPGDGLPVVALAATAGALVAWHLGPDLEPAAAWAAWLLGALGPIAASSVHSGRYGLYACHPPSSARPDPAAGHGRGSLRAPHRTGSA